MPQTVPVDGRPEASDRPGEGDGPGDHQIEADHIDRVGHGGVLQPPFEQEHQHRRTQAGRQAEERQGRTEQAEQPAQTFPLHSGLLRSLTVKTLPCPIWLSTPISPPKMSTTRFTSASPSPLPWAVCEESP